MGRTRRIVRPPATIATQGHAGLLTDNTNPPSRTSNDWKSTTKRAETTMAKHAERRVIAGVIEMQ